MPMTTTANQPDRSPGPIKQLARGVASLAATPIRKLAREREPAVADPGALQPGDKPPTDGRLLLIYDGGCGICLHARDVFAAWDFRHRLAHDRIARHDQGLLADMDPIERYSSWHAVHPDGRMEHGADALAALFNELPGAQPISWSIRRFPGPYDAFYKWFVRNRPWISQGANLINHPQRDPREQLTNPRHDEVAPS